jgi:hypothetical protein
MPTVADVAEPENLTTDSPRAGQSVSACGPLVLVLCLLGLSCARAREADRVPSPPPGGAAVIAATAPSVALPYDPSAAPSVAASGTMPPSSAASVSGAPESVPQPSLHDAEGKPLPQTDERPRADDPAFLARLELLVRAIERDDPELARPAFFPVVAYQQVKAIEKPERDHEGRLMKAFARDVHEYHRALGTDAEGVRFVDLEIPEARVKFMKPGAEGNRLGYFRIVRPTLRLRTRDGKERSFEVTSLISWRGGWYVVHLHGFS